MHGEDAVGGGIIKKVKDSVFDGINRVFLYLFNLYYISAINY